MINTTYPSQYMALWLKASHPSSPSSCATNNSKAEGYSVVQINNLPTVTSAISVISSWIGTTLAGIVPSWIIFGIATGAAIFGTVCLTIWNIPTALK
jgi:ACS family pantothenate transporter-like MFS transporter